MQALMTSKKNDIIIERNDLLALPAPEQEKDSHVKIHHGTLLTTIEDSMQGKYDIVDQQHAITKDGNRYFGLLKLNLDYSDHEALVAIRNSHDKKFPASICAGSRVMVCSNLAFSGEVKIARRHTKYIMRDLPNVVTRAVGMLEQRYVDQEHQISAYKARELSDDRARSLMIDMMKAQVFPCTNLPAILEQWESPAHEEFSDLNVWRLFNAVTEVAKKWSIENTFKRTALLHTICNLESGYRQAEAVEQLAA